MCKIKYFLYILIQCTWGAIQTLLGFLLFIIFICCEHSFYHGCIKTNFGNRFSVSLGMFIFVSDKLGAEESDKTAVHEYGHTIQSLILGPLYLIVVGLPSFTWCLLPYFQKKREEKKIPYSSFWVENWADILGEKYTIKS